MANNRVQQRNKAIAERNKSNYQAYFQGSQLINREIGKCSINS